MQFVYTVVLRNTISDILGLMRLCLETNYKKEFLKRMSTRYTVCFLFSNKDELLTRVNPVLTLRIPLIKNRETNVIVWMYMPSKLDVQDLTNFMYRKVGIALCNYV